jgi:hypothetical protein
MLTRFLAEADAERASRTLLKLARHDISQWALTGRLAIEIHQLRRGCGIPSRTLNDIDFVAESFDRIPETLASDFLFRHVHPLDPPGKNMAQMVDRDTAVRIDIFRANGATMNRTTEIDLPCGRIQMVSLEDLTARATRLALDLAEGAPTPAKHARGFLNLAKLADSELMEAAWHDHRKPKQPRTFVAANSLLQQLIASHPGLLITSIYSRNTEELCARCAATPAFPLANAQAVLELLGYC